MKAFSLALLGSLVAAVVADELTDAAPDVVGDFNITEALTETKASGIDLTVLDFSTDALSYINTVAAEAASPSSAKKRANTGNVIDVHSHLVFPWYKQLVPTTGGQPTPDWTPEAHLAFARSNSIVRTVLGNSAPQSNVFFGDKIKTVALARLLNVAVTAVTRLYPRDFSHFCVVPLPYVNEAIAEAKYCLDNLGGVGITTMTNHEGLYLGNSQFKPFFQYINSRPGKTIVYIHPTHPYLRKNGQVIEANPTLYMTGLVEFYFETARCLMDLTYTQTLANFTNIQYISAHVGGAFPSILDRMIKSVPQLEATAKQIYQTRIFWDSAGPTYPNQVKGLLAYGVPNSQLIYGSDYPYAPSFTYAGAMAGLVNAPFLTQTEITAILTNNSQALFGNKIQW